MPREASGNDVWEQVVLDLCDLILKHQFPFLQSLKKKLVDRRTGNKRLDLIIKRTMLLFQGGQLLQRGTIDRAGINALGQCIKPLGFQPADKRQRGIFLVVSVFCGFHNLRTGLSGIDQDIV